MTKSVHILEAWVNTTTHEGIDETVKIKGIRCTWVWEQMSREAAERWAVIDYVSDTFNFKSFSVVSIASSAALEV
jgi:hypothetical protein